MRRVSLTSACREALDAARANLLRSALAALATTAAVATMVIVISGLDGLARFARETGERTFGSNTFVIAQVSSGQLSRRELELRLERNPPIRRSDVRFLDRVSNGDVLYAPTAQRNVQVVAGNKSFDNAALNGTSASLPAIRVIEMDDGRFFTATEVAQAAQVAVIGANVADTLFPSQRPLGKHVRIAGRRFEVIGAMTRQGQAGGVTLDRYVYVPLTAYERAFGGTASLQVFARAADEVPAMRGEDIAHASMRARRQLGPGEADNFDIVTPEAARSFVLQLASRISAAAIPISLMALVAAIVVVTNTVLVSVTQRTRDIGIRRAVGAPQTQILAEVLAESMLTAVVGGTIGIMVAIAILAAASAGFGIALLPTTGTVVTAMLAAGGTGLLAGYFPARQAARIDVITALRAE